MGDFNDIEEWEASSADIVGIVGSREYPDLDKVRAYVRALPKGTTVVSGGARGVDSAAIEEAKACGLKVIIHLADWETYGKAAGMIRNALIVDDSRRIAAFWDLKSRGTKDTIDRARKANKTVEIFTP